MSGFYCFAAECSNQALAEFRGGCASHPRSELDVVLGWLAVSKAVASSIAKSHGVSSDAYHRAEQELNWTRDEVARVRKEIN